MFLQSINNITADLAIEITSYLSHHSRNITQLTKGSSGDLINSNVNNTSPGRNHWFFRIKPASQNLVLILQFERWLKKKTDYWEKGLEEHYIIVERCGNVTVNSCGETIYCPAGQDRKSTARNCRNLIVFGHYWQCSLWPEIIILWFLTFNEDIWIVVTGVM